MFGTDESCLYHSTQICSIECRNRQPPVREGLTTINNLTITAQFFHFPVPGRLVSLVVDVQKVAKTKQAVVGDEDWVDEEACERAGGEVVFAEVD